MDESSEALVNLAHDLLCDSVVAAERRRSVRMVQTARIEGERQVGKAMNLTREHSLYHSSLGVRCFSLEASKVIMTCSRRERCGSVDGSRKR